MTNSRIYPKVINLSSPPTQSKWKPDILIYFFSSVPPARPPAPRCLFAWLQKRKEKGKKWMVQWGGTAMLSILHSFFCFEKIICQNEPEAMKSGDEEFPFVGKYPIYQLPVGKPSLFQLRRPHLAKLHKCCSWVINKLPVTDDYMNKYRFRTSPGAVGTKALWSALRWIMLSTVEI